MNVNILILVLWNIASVIKTQEAFLNPTPTDWMTAGKSCDLLGHSSTSSFENLHVTTTSIGQQGWISAIMHYTPWIKMMGCYSVSNMSLYSTVRFQHFPNDVMSCVNACVGYSQYGLSGNSCYCMQSMPTSTMFSCMAHICPGTQDFCGGTTFLLYTDIVIYAIDSSYTLSADGGGCMTSLLSYKDDDEYTFNATAVSCNASMNYCACVSRSSQWPFLISFGNGTGNWTDAANKCHTYGYSMATSSVLMSADSSVYSYSAGMPVWIGVFRRQRQTWTTSLPSIPTSSNIHTLCVAAEISSNGGLSTQLRNCNENLPFFCQQSVATSSTMKGLPASAIAAIVVVTLVVVIIATSVIIVKKQLKRYIYVGRRRKLSDNNSDTSSTFSRRTLVSESYANPKDIRVSRFISTRSFDTTDQELATEGEYNHLDHNNDSAVQSITEGSTYNVLEFKNLKLRLDSSSTYDTAIRQDVKDTGTRLGLYDLSNGQDVYNTLHRTDSLGTETVGFEQYDHIVQKK